MFKKSLTTIALSLETKERLDEIKAKTRKTYDEIIQYLLDKDNDEYKIDIRKYIARGSVISLEGVLKMIKKEVREKMKALCVEKVVEEENGEIYYEYVC